jgi:hypothetical protein
MTDLFPHNSDTLHQFEPLIHRNPNLFPQLNNPFLLFERYSIQGVKATPDGLLLLHIAKTACFYVVL